MFQKYMVPVLVLSVSVGLQLVSLSKQFGVSEAATLTYLENFSTTTHQRQ